MILNIILSMPFNIIILSVILKIWKRIEIKKLVILNFILIFFNSIYIFLEIGIWNEIINLNIWTWVNLGILKINLGFLFDTLTIIMVLVVFFISSLVHIYSFSYMKTDPHLLRFLSYLSFFTFFMLILITADNLLQLLIGWEGVGLSSYLLICFWYTRISANLAAIKAMLINRIGDVCLIFVLCLFLEYLGSVNYGIIFNNITELKNIYIDIFFFEINLIDLISLLLLLGAMGKSAQLLLHVWLPDAMEGPTPVSALIHAATMVTAGVFLVIRCSKLFELSSTILFVMVFIGSISCLLMSLIGTSQQDIKKIVAYSTASQLGYMFIGCGLSNYSVSLFHLFNHAFFKALLFLSMGVIIHALQDEQDLRRMGSLINLLPFTGVMVFFGSYALLGLPFLAGFYSKDIIVETMFIRFILDGFFCYIIGIFGALCTAFYSTRLFLRVFFNYLNVTNKRYLFIIEEADKEMYIPLIILFIASLFVGFFFTDMFIGLGSIFFSNEIFVFFFNQIVMEFEINNVIKLFPLFFSLLGVIIYYNFDLKRFIFFYSDIFRFIFNILSNSFFFDSLYINKFLLYFWFFSKESYFINIEVNFFQLINKIIIENYIKNFYFFFKFFTNGQIYIYILIVINFFIMLNLVIFCCYYLNIYFTFILIYLFLFSFFLQKKNIYFLLKNI